jgi:hypothetical protein
MSLSARYLQIPILSHLPHSFSSHFPQSFSPRIQHISKLSLLVCLIISIFYFTLSPSHLSASNYKTFSITTSGRKTSFIQSTLATEIDGPLDNSTLAQLCASRKWTPGLIFKCEAPQDGIVNSKNVVLNCVRFAIEAGGSSSSPLLSISFPNQWLISPLSSNRPHHPPPLNPRTSPQPTHPRPFHTPLRPRTLHNNAA